MASQRRRTVPLLVFAGLALVLLGANVKAEEADQTPSAQAVSGTVCFIIRTYWGHGDTWGDKSLRRLLGTLRNQTVGSWEALLVVMDNRPFPEIRKILREINDSRVWVHAEWINFKYNPKEGGVWAPSYHNKLYNLTDMAIRACPERADWVVVTNGDNTYDQTFVETVLSAPPGSDVVAIDFYSRYQRPTWYPCERFEVGEGMPPCKQNEMRFCQTDLAANAYRLERLLAEDRRFGLVDPTGTHGANDGIMAQMLKTAGWKIHFVHGRCLINHAPSPQQCALAGGVWDDTIMNQASSFGGTCATVKSVVDRMRTYPDVYELLELNVTFDRDSFTFGSYDFLELRCLRLANRSLWHQEQVFGRVCAAQVDAPHLSPELPPHPWDEWVEAPEEAGTTSNGMGQEVEEEAGEVEWKPVGGPAAEAAGQGSASERDEL